MNTFKIRYEGQNISPENIRIDFLIETLPKIQKILALLSESYLHKKDIKKINKNTIKEYNLSIKNIETGSVVLEIGEFIENKKLINNENKIQKAIELLNETNSIFKSGEIDSFDEKYPYNTKKLVLKEFKKISEYTKNNHIDFSYYYNQNHILYKEEFFENLEEKIFKDDIIISKEIKIGMVSLNDVYKNNTEVRAGEKDKIKIPKKYYKDFIKFFKKPVLINGKFRIEKNNPEISLKELEKVEELPKNFNVNKINYENRSFMFKNPLNLKYEVQEDGYTEIHIPLFNTLEYGDNFAEAWFYLKQEIADTYDLLFESKYKNKLSKFSKELKDYLSKNLEVKKNF
jgi:hypothetical protein